jgi:hypothetical protein
MDLSHPGAFKMRRLVSVQFIPQEYRVNLHSRLIPGGLSKRLRSDSDVIGIEVEDMPGEEISGVRLPVEREVLARCLAASVKTATGLLTGEILPSLVDRFAAK